MTQFQVDVIDTLTRYACEAHDTAERLREAATKTANAGEVEYLRSVAADYTRKARQYESQIRARLSK